MKKIIDLQSWNRREHFQFFSQFDDPYHGVMANLDCTNAYQHCKQQGSSFFLFYLHQVLRAVNLTEAMRYRIEDDQVIDYSVIHASATVSRADHTFGFCPISFNDCFSSFVNDAQQAMQGIKDASGLCFSPELERNDVIHFSVMPWISFTGVTHARQLQKKDSVPKITVGKYFRQDERLMLPLAVYVHHALADAYHVHQFLHALENLFENPATS